MKKLTLLLLTTWMLTGCAAIFGSNEETVTINSTPDNVPFAVIDHTGAITATGVTPKTLALKKSDGSYFGKREYSLTLRQPGYYSASMPLAYRFSRWYTLGNVIFLGVPGWLIVDPFFGGMYTLKEDSVHVILRPCSRGPFSDMCS